LEHAQPDQTRGGAAAMQAILAVPVISTFANLGRFAVRVGTAVVDRRTYAVCERLGQLYPLVGGEDRDLSDLIRAGASLDAQATPLNGAKLLAPLRPRQIIAVGLNYMDHIRESGLTQPSEPLLFAKLPSSVIGTNVPIIVDTSVTRRVDWEVELAVVIGRKNHLVPRQVALSHVFGYTVANDISARDLQFSDGQWVRGKSLDTFCPLGPFIVTSDEVVDPQALDLRTWVNGKLVQHSSTANMIFPVDELVAYCSRHFTLEAGDVLLTGTPWGCGEFASPRQSLSDGDVVTVSVEGVGMLRNTVEFVDSRRVPSSAQTSQPES
jgi:5-carboxymethyl-2-hydroxymuconate isomerase